MPIGTPFHPRTSALSESQNWRNWSGYFVAGSYDVMHDYEYHAIRNSAGLIDVSPLFKYEIRGRDALKLVNRVMTRDAAKCAVGQALYGCLCEDDGAVIQDGTVFSSRRRTFSFPSRRSEPALAAPQCRGHDSEYPGSFRADCRARTARAQLIQHFATAGRC